jgi:peroxiredoxin
MYADAKREPDLDYEPDEAAIRARAMRGPISQRLDVIADDFRQRLGDYSRALDALVERLMRSEAGRTAPDVGDMFPDFVLPDAHGRLWSLAVALQAGPVILAFHRGYWCDFCHLNMAALADLWPQVKAFGSQIVAISPQDADNGRKLLRDSGADFPMLCDMGLAVSSMLGLAYAVDDDIRRELALLQVDLNSENSGHGWLLPITATFFIDTSGKVMARHLDPDPRQRMDGEAILQAAANCHFAARS